MSLVWGRCLECSLQFFSVDPGQEHTVPCPHCHGQVEVQRGPVPAETR